MRSLIFLVLDLIIYSKNKGGGILADKTTTVNVNDLNADPATGDILGAMQSQQASISSVFSELKNTSKNILNIYELQKEIKDQIKRQADITEKIFNLLMLWSRKGGISDPARSGSIGLNTGNPIGGNGGGYSSAVNSFTRTVNESSKALANHNKQLAQQKALQETLTARLEQLLVTQRENFSINQTQLLKTQSSWDTAMGDFIKKIQDKSHFSFDSSPEDINSKIKSNTLHISDIDSGQSGITRALLEPITTEYKMLFNSLLSSKNPFTNNPDRITEFSEEQIEEAKRKAVDSANQRFDNLDEEQKKELRQQYSEKQENLPTLDEETIKKAEEQASQEVKEFITTLFRDLKTTAGKLIDDQGNTQTLKRGDIEGLTQLSDEELQKKLTSVDDNNVSSVRDILNQFQELYTTGKQKKAEEQAPQEVKESITTLFRDLKNTAGKLIDDQGNTQTLKRGDIEGLTQLSDDELQKKLTGVDANNVSSVRDTLNQFQELYTTGKQKKIDELASQHKEEASNALIDEAIKNDMKDEAFNASLNELGDVVGGASDLLNTLPKVINMYNALSQDKTFGQGGKGKDVGNAAGTALGGIAGETISKSISTALIPELGPLGSVVGEIIGKKLEDTIISAFDAVGELLDDVISAGQKLSQTAINVGFEKIRQDVKTMGSYQLDIYEQATQQLYSAWDKNLSKISATQGYTKDALDTLQVDIAKRLESEGYGQAINVAQYSDLLTSTLSSNLSGALAEEFAYQSLILQKAIPEFNSAQMAEQFAAIWSKAEYEGSSGKEQMVIAMEQIAGAIKTIKETTEGNNKFISAVPQYLTQAQTMVERAGGSVDKVAELTTQMMAAEGPMAAIAPQLSGFTGELIQILADQNNATSVALRSIMHDMDESIGILNTDFMKSFMDNTQGTLETAYRALGEFIEKNQDPGAEQEFYVAMQDLFGISAEKLSQIDFSYIADKIAATNANLNTAAVLDAQALVMSGETTTLEEQLVNNTANMVMAQNAIADTLDNNLMRKLEKNELNMERLIYEEMATQSVELAENTLGFFKKIGDILFKIIDPFGLIKGALGLVNSSVSAAESLSQNLENYEIAQTLSSVGESTEASQAATEANTVGGANAAIAQGTQGSMLFGTRVDELQKAMDESGIAGSQGIGSLKSLAAMQIASSQSNANKAAEASAQAVELVNSTVSNKSKEETESEFKATTEQGAEALLEKATQGENREIEVHDATLVIKEDTELILELVAQYSAVLEDIDSNLSIINSYTQEINQTVWDTTGLIAGIQNTLDNMAVASDDFWESIPRYLKLINEEVTIRTYKMRKDFYKDMGDGVDIVQNSLTVVSDYVKTIKDTLDGSGTTTSNKLENIFQELKVVDNNVQKNTSEIKTKLETGNSSLSTIDMKLGDINTLYSSQSTIIISYLSVTAMNTSQTVSTLDRFIQTFESNMTSVISKMETIRAMTQNVRDTVNTHGRNIKESMDTVSNNILISKNILDNIKIDTGNIDGKLDVQRGDLSEIRDKIIQAEHYLWETTEERGEYSLSRTNDILEGIRVSIQDQDGIHSKMDAANGYLFDILRWLRETLDGKLNEIKNATENVSVNVNNEYSYITQ